jgi:hypothetical protein
VTSYTGPDAPQMARQMVLELRNHYKLPAFVFNRGAEERRKEQERVRAVVEKQREFLKQNNLPLDQPIRVRTMRIEEQCAVLLGGYASDEAARKALDGIRKLTPPDPRRVKLNIGFFLKEDPKQPNKVQDSVGGYLNPFKQAFVVRNPTIRSERPQEWDQLDIESLKRLNAGESFSLLKCKKPLTLAVKQFQTPTVVQPKSAKGGFLETLGLGKKSGERVDAAAHSAHNLAELLRKANLEAYVLHTKYASVVTVGGFDSLEDPNLKSTQNIIATRLKLDPVGADPALRQSLQLFPQPIPMKVPR